MIDDLPQLLYETLKSLLRKMELKVEVYLWGQFYGVTKDQEEKANISKNKYILNKDDLKSVIYSLLNQIKNKIYSWDNNEALARKKAIQTADAILRKSRKAIIQSFEFRAFSVAVISMYFFYTKYANKIITQIKIYYSN